MIQIYAYCTHGLFNNPSVHPSLAARIRSVLGKAVPHTPIGVRSLRPCSPRNCCNRPRRNFLQSTKVIDESSLVELLDALLAVAFIDLGRTIAQLVQHMSIRKPAGGISPTHNRNHQETVYAFLEKFVSALSYKLVFRACEIHPVRKLGRK
ncbi:hypothetical protein BDV36DRAFT_229291 [Aspergillus pseudocaelatus]|uniref:RNase III domain-containing protein n=1 Tax=Aspergillus pseudocaelatus TaxID=1825620 RepID=A0ABQ6WEJ1_9EURO|nr:hypothetical protein BDV36DRAFT_229291 [Aspergillus pseudocaelatus]